MALAEAMVRLYHLSDGQQQAMGEYSREKALGQFDEKIIVWAYLELCGELLVNPGQQTEKILIPSREKL